MPITARSPFGVLVRDDGSLELVYDALDLPDGVLVAPNIQAPSLDDDTLCLDQDCAEWGCWCRSVQGLDETYHCCECAEPYAVDYQCLLYRRLCPACCKHGGCNAAWTRLLGRPAEAV